MYCSIYFILLRDLFWFSYVIIQITTVIEFAKLFTLF
jgi:hypothetical protein